MNGFVNNISDALKACNTGGSMMVLGLKSVY